MPVSINLSQENINKLYASIEKHKQKPGPLMPTLHDAQDIFGCIPQTVQKIISKELGVSVARINGVVTFYSRFSLEPKGQNVINVCLGTACYVKGSQSILDEFTESLGVKVGQTSSDGKFTLESARCIGACGLAPVFTINDKVYGHANRQMAKEVINTILQKDE